MDIITSDIVAVACYNVCQQTQADTSLVPAWTDVALLIGTAAVETGFDNTKIGGGIGVFGMTFGAAKSSYELLEPKDDQSERMWDIFVSAWLGISGVPYISLSDKDLRYLLAHDIRFAASMCRWYYLISIQSNSKSLSDIANLWHMLWNINAAIGPDRFLQTWTDKECMTLMSVLGYE